MYAAHGVDIMQAAKHFHWLPVSLWLCPGARTKSPAKRYVIGWSRCVRMICEEAARWVCRVASGRQAGEDARALTVSKYVSGLW